MYAKKEFESLNPSFPRLKKLIESAEKSEVTFIAAQELNQKFRQTTSADTLIENIIQKTNKALSQENTGLSIYINLFNEGTNLLTQPSHRIKELEIVIDQLRQVLSTQIRHFLDKLVNNPQEINDTSQIALVIKWVKENDFDFEGDLDGAYYEALAWESLANNSISKNHWEATERYWREAELRKRPRAYLHRLCSQKALVLTNAQKGSYSTLVSTRSEPLLYDDDDIAIIYAESLLKQYEEEYKTPEILAEIEGTNKFNNVKNILSKILGRENPPDEIEKEAQINNRLMKLEFNQLWSQFYNHKAPKPQNLKSISELIDRRKNLFSDLISVVKKLKIDGYICDYYEGIELARKIINRLERMDQRNPGNKEDTTLFKSLWFKFQQFSLERLRH